ncbi:AmmeMemoRadiSam system protein A [Patescibacteria group bacterium]|nr:AmmeMemoRadiSam system protein A [Patescibacteria group bacterium]
MLSQTAKQELLNISRKTLEEFVENRQIPEVQVENISLHEPRGVFVTLRVKDQLRGCLGLMIAEDPLWQVVQTQTVAAAVSDPRFESVQPSELPDVEIEISVLSPLKKIDFWKEIKLGQHGVLIKRGPHSGVFLPQVAAETDWDLETFLQNLCSHKAGLPPDSYKDPMTEIFVFTVEKITG